MVGPKTFCFSRGTLLKFRISWDIFWRPGCPLPIGIRHFLSGIRRYIIAEKLLVRHLSAGAPTGRTHYIDVA